jgi:hypothetical protein
MNQQIVELMKAQMMLTSGGGARSFIAVSMFERIISSFPLWSGYVGVVAGSLQTHRQ